MDPFQSLKSNSCPPGHFIGEGYKVVRRMLQFSKVKKILLTPEWHKKFNDQIGPETEVAIRPQKELEEIIGFRIHQGILALGEIPEAPEKPLTGLLVALDGISDAENVGAILRTCAAFGVNGVLVGSDTCSPWIRRAIRVSLGAPLQVPVFFTKNLAETLRSLDLPSYAAHIHGEHVDLGKIDLSPPSCIVLGGEADGVSKEVLQVCRKTIYIPMAQGWDCLNVSASASVLLYEATRKRES